MFELRVLLNRDLREGSLEILLHNLMLFSVNDFPGQ